MQTIFPGDLGPLPTPDGILYRVWAYGHREVTVCVEKWCDAKSGHTYAVVLKPSTVNGEEGYFSGLDRKGAAGDLYRVTIDGKPVPDFASHFQPRGAAGPSMVIDAGKFAWQTTQWKRPAWNGQVVYEIHLGTFTPGGTYLAAIEKLDHLVELGVTAVEIMPVAEWWGERNWGYDGVLLFAPTHTYGTPDEFRTLIDACHRRGLAVMLDLVYNHLGPEGNYSHHYSDHFFHADRDNPWGRNFNLDGPHSAPVRALLRQNIRYWLDEFRLDGFRMDATHAIHDPSTVHLLAEAAEIVRSRGAFIVAEDDRNARLILEPPSRGGWDFHALWSDDFHHIIRMSQTGEKHYFFSMFQGTAGELLQTVRHGWFYRGQVSPFHQAPRGTPADDFPPESFVYCISNHDQVGNRLLGDRLHQSITPAAYRALSLFLCLVPATPLLFMGQEWAAATPFHYFTDMPPELGRNILAGRKRELLESGAVTDPAELEKMADPQDPKTFEESKLDWSELARPGHREVLELYRSALRLRREIFGPANPGRDLWKVEPLPDGLVIHYRTPRPILVYLYLKQRTALPEGRILLRSNAPEFGGSPDANPGEPETIILSPM